MRRRSGLARLDDTDEQGKQHPELAVSLWTAGQASSPFYFGSKIRKRRGADLRKPELRVCRHTAASIIDG
jgi:hypothetical protein